MYYLTTEVDGKETTKRPVLEKVVDHSVNIVNRDNKRSIRFRWIICISGNDIIESLYDFGNRNKASNGKIEVYTLPHKATREDVKGFVERSTVNFISHFEKELG